MSTSRAESADQLDELAAEFRNRHWAAAARWLRAPRGPKPRPLDRHLDDMADLLDHGDVNSIPQAARMAANEMPGSATSESKAKLLERKYRDRLKKVGTG